MAHLNKMSVRILLLLGVCCAACLTPTLAVTCYIEGPAGGVFPYAQKPTKDTPNPACLSFKLDCKRLSQCKAGENGKWVYTVTSETECAKIKALPDVYTNMKCCTKDQCNAPDPKLDPTTKIITHPLVHLSHDDPVAMIVRRLQLRISREAVAPCRKAEGIEPCAAQSCKKPYCCGPSRELV